MSSSPVLRRPGAAIQELEIVPLACVDKGPAHTTNPYADHSLILPTQIPISSLFGASAPPLLQPIQREPVDALTLAKVDNLQLGSNQVGPAHLDPSGRTPTGSELAGRLGFSLAVKSPIAVASIQLLIYARDTVIYQTSANSSYANKALPPLQAQDGQGVYIFILNDAAVKAAGQFLTGDFGISVAVTLQKPTPPPEFAALPAGSIQVFDQRPSLVFAEPV